MKNLRTEIVKIIKSSLGWVTPLSLQFILNLMHLILPRIFGIFGTQGFSPLGLLIIINYTRLVSLTQKGGQYVNEYLATLQPIWTQLDQAKISPDHIRLIQVLMSLCLEYESIRAALLHRNPLPSLDAAIQEILFEEKRLGIVSPLPSDVALATTYLRPANETTFCKNYKLHGHKFANCPTIECKYCHKRVQVLSQARSHPGKLSHSPTPLFWSLL